MYISYYRLNSKPFEPRPNESFFWFGEKRREILSALQSGIQSNRAFQLITGDAGVGKSTMIQALVNGLDDSVMWAIIDNPRTGVLSFYNEIGSGFRLGKEVTSKVQFLVEFSHFLKKADERGVQVLLIIDNAQRLDQETLEEIRMLSNIEKDGSKLLDILLVGRSKFTALLSLPKNRVVRQRLTFQADLKSFDQFETREYINHRLTAAECKQTIFTDNALVLLHKFSGGIPGRINTICDCCLELGATRELEVVDTTVVEECIRDQNGVQGVPDLRKETEEGEPTPQQSENFEVEDRVDHLTDIQIDTGDPEEVILAGVAKTNPHKWLLYGGGLLILGALSLFILVPWMSAPKPVMKVSEPMTVEKIKQNTQNSQSTSKKSSVIIIPGSASPGQSLGKIEIRASEKTPTQAVADTTKSKDEAVGPAAKVTVKEVSTPQVIPERKSESRIVVRKLIVL